MLAIKMAIGDLMLVGKFRNHCADGYLIDDDGYGYPATAFEYDDTVVVYPSERDKIPSWATHVLWLNR